MIIYNLDDANAHVGIFGKTGGGKTYYTKALLEQQMNKGYIDKNHIYIFTTKTNNNADWEGYKTFDDFDDKMESIWEKHTTQRVPAIIVFDDYLNTEAYSFNNRQLKRLFTEGRKHCIHGVIQSHEPNGINPFIRNSLSYKVMFPSGDKKFIEKLSSNFLYGDTNKLMALFKETQNKPPHTAVVQLPSAELTFDKAETGNNSNNNEVKLGGDTHQTINNMGNNNTNQIYNQQTIDAENLRQTNKIAHETRMDGLKYDEEYDRQQIINNTKVLCRQVSFKPRDKQKLIYNLNFLRRGKIPVNYDNLAVACNNFMKKYDPDNSYQFVEADTVILRDVVSTYAEQGKDGIMDIGLSYILDKTEQSSIVGSGLSVVKNLFLN